MYTFSAVLPAYKVHEVIKEGLRKCVDKLLRVFCHQKQLTLV